MKTERKYDSKEGFPYCKHGEIIEDGENYDACYGANHIYITADDIERIKDGAMFYYTDEEYSYCLVYKEVAKPAEPLIKDEKIRKALRAWAEASGITKVLSYGDIFWLGFRSINTASVWKFECFYTDTSEFKLDKEYTIAELCGEDK